MQPPKRLFPKRWLNYSRHAQIAGTRFIASKTPLSQNRNEQLHRDERYSVNNLLEEYPKIKLVICLVFGPIYYDPSEFTSRGVEYIRIQVGYCNFRPDLYNRFRNVVNTFLRTRRSDDLICVHCSHGLNRTGYFICRYMIEYLGWETEEAIRVFEASRGHSMERFKYLNKLRLFGAMQKTPYPSLETPRTGW